MNTIKNLKDKNIFKISLISGLITFFIFFILTSLASCNPMFGGLLYGGDLADQYLSFFQGYRHILMGNWNSLGYSLSNGLGGAMVGNVGYYLLSPFNLLILLFPVNHLDLAIYIIILIKLSLASATFTWLILKWFNFKYKIYSIFLGIGYGLSAYCTAYCANIMWLDSIILLPLINYFLVKGLREKSWIPYIILLACAIIFNYYTGYMICFFIVIVFLAYSINYFESIKKFFNQAIHFALSSLISGCLSAFITLPTILNLFNNKLSQTENFNTGYVINKISTLKRLDSRLFIGDVVEGAPLIFVGSLLMLFFLLYFFDSKISLKERIINIVIGGFFLLSFTVPKLYLMWHGGQKTIDFPYRFLFIVVFWILILAARELSDFVVKKKVLFVVAGLYFLCGLAMIYIRHQLGLARFYGVVALIIIVIMTLCIYLFNNKIARVILLVIAVLEISFNDYLTLKIIGMNQNTYASYVATNQKLFAKLPTQDKKGRISKNYFLNNDRNEAYTFNYRGAEVFSSNNDPKLSNFYKNIGLGESGKGSYGYFYFYENGTIVTDAIFNVQTIINSNLSNQSISPDYISYGLRDDVKNKPVLLTQNHFKVYKNKTLPWIFAGGLSNNLKYYNDDPVYNQNLVLNSLTQTNADVLNYTDVQPLVAYKGLKINKYDNNFLLEKKSFDKEGYLSFNYSGLKSKQVAYLKFDKNNKLMNTVNVLDKVQHPSINPQVQIIINNKPVFLSPNYTQLVGVQATNQGKVTVKVKLQQINSLNLATPSLIKINDTILDKKVKKAQSQKMNFKEFRDNYIDGTIKIKKGENLVTTIPYSSGWKATIDGKKASISRTLGVFLGLKLQAGEHHIIFSYEIPGLKLGILISTLGIAALVIDIIFKKKQK